MRIVITGGLGFIGQNLSVYLKSRDQSFDLIAIDWLADATTEDTEYFDDVASCCFSSTAALELCLDADVVVHLAACTCVRRSVEDPETTFQENVTKTQILLDYLRKNSPKTKVIFASTGGAIVGDYDGAVHEGIAPCPVSPYGASKLAAEGLLSAYKGSYGLNFAALRFSNVYGPRSHRNSSVITSFCKSYLKDGKMHINGDGEQTRDYIFAGDISEAIWCAIEKDAKGVFQLGTGRAVSVNELVDVFESLDSDNRFERIHGPALKGEVRHNKADISHIRKTLGFEPTDALEDGIRETLEWFRKKHS